MKTYQKPVIVYEALELSQSIAACSNSVVLPAITDDLMNANNIQGNNDPVSIQIIRVDGQEDVVFFSNNNFCPGSTKEHQSLVGFKNYVTGLRADTTNYFTGS